MGNVYAHVGQRFTETRYDVLVLGAGRMGSLCAHFLLRAAPHLNVLLLDEGGLPNEDGATALAPGVWTQLDIGGAQQERAEFTRRLILGQLSEEEGDLGQGSPHDAPTLPRGLLEWSRPAGDPQALPMSAATTAQVADLSSRLPPGSWPSGKGVADPSALTYSPAALTIRAAQRAIGAGADLMLNVRATPTLRGARLERLTVTNTHQIVVHETCHVEVGQLIIAAGVAGPGLAEQHLGAVTHHARVYRQLPRLNVPTDDRTPVLRWRGLTLRPHAGGFTVVTPVHHRDPHGYLPTGGRLSGVPVGLRREVLQDLLEAMPALPALGTQALEVGRSVSDVPGAWWVLPEGGWPCFEALGGGAWLLLGGPQADLTGAGVARELALAVIGQVGR